MPIPIGIGIGTPFSGGYSFVPQGGGVRAKLAFDLVSNQAFVSGSVASASSLIAVTRATPALAYAQNTSGVWIGFAPNTLRWTNKGALFEESRKNSLRNNTMAGAVVGSPGTAPNFWVFPSNPANGIAWSIIGIGTDTDNSKYIDIRLNGTASASSSTQISFEATNQIVASSGQIWSRSVFMRYVSGSKTGINAINHIMQGRDSGNTTFTETFTDDITASVTTAINRASKTDTLANASTAFVNSSFNITYTNGAVIDITLRVGWPQIELGNVATSPIPTATVEVTRAQDVPTYTVPAALQGLGSYTLYAKAIPNMPVTYGATQSLVQFDDASDANRLALQRLLTTGFDIELDTVSSVAVFTGTRAAMSQNSASTLAIAATAGAQSSCLNGGTVQTGTGTMPAGLTRLVFGNNSASGLPLNGYLQTVALWDSKLANGSLQTIQ